MPLSQTARSILTEYLDRYPAIGSAPIFRNAHGNLIDYDHWRQLHWNPAVQAANRDEPRPTSHDLRRGFGAELVRHRISMRHAQKLLRHSDIRITASLYADLSIEDLRNAIESVETAR